jgi:hypothetical protein
VHHEQPEGDKHRSEIFLVRLAEREGRRLVDGPFEVEAGRHAGPHNPRLQQLSGSIDEQAEPF